MALNETIARLRQDRGLTQSELAAKLYVTRQAVSRWETGETMPGIDMCKLLAVTLEVPIACLLEMPDWPVCQSCGMPLQRQEDCGTEANGSISKNYCGHCYHEGRYRYEADLDEMIERCAPFMAEHSGMTLDEAVSFMGAILPMLERWRAISENERIYGAEARERYGDDVIDAANSKLLAMEVDEWKNVNKLEHAIQDQLALAFAAGDTNSPEARKLCAMHAQWIQAQWPEGAYSAEAHLGLAHGYLADDRFVAYYDESAGEGATRFLVSALEQYLAK